MKITIAQLNPIVGDIDGNLKKTNDVLAEYGGKTDLIVFPELFLTGYPPRDLLEKPDLIGKAQFAIGKIADVSKHYPDTGILVGVPMPG